MKSYFITSKGVRLIAHDLFVIADKYGLNEVNLWCADAVANDIVSKADFDHDMQRDGHFVHELGIRSPQGHPLTISIDRAHCEALSLRSES